MKKQMKIENILTWVIGLYILFLCSDLSTAGYSISCALLILCSIIFYTKSRPFSTLLFSFKYFYVLYFTFFISIMISAILLGERSAIQATVNYVLFSAPMWLLMFSLCTQKKKCFAIGWGSFGAAFFLVCSALYSLLLLPWGTRIIGPFSQPNRLAVVLEIIIPFLIAVFCHINQDKGSAGFSNKIVRWIMVLVIIAVIFVMLLTQSRGGIGGLFFGICSVIVIKYLQRKHIRNVKVRFCIILSALAILSSGIVFITIETFHRNYDNERILLLKSTYQMWNDHKIYGVGMGNWQTLYQQKYILPEAKEPNLPFPHNNIASFFSMTGVIGGGGYLIFSIGSLIFLIRKIDEYPDNPYLYAMLCVNIAIFSHGMVENTLYQHKFAIRMFFGMWGITLASFPYFTLKK